MKFGVCLLVLAAVLCVPVAGAEFVLNPGDHIAFIGNALPDRMQHDGWLESCLQQTNPDKELVIRNLGFTGDQVTKRPRNENFMPVDDTLRLVGADVIFAFFGYNESFAHDPVAFKKDLIQFIDETRSKQYNGKSAPRIVLFSPIAHENLESPNLPDGQENNLWLSIYTDAMARVAQQKEVTFVDLFAATQKLYAESDEALTINGVHLNSLGNKRVAQVIVAALGMTAEMRGIMKIRTAVLEKNWCWFNRYRATDGNDVWGSRSVLKFVNDQTNGEVLQHELVMLDVMTANRDQVIWKANQGEIISPDDSNVPKPVPVITNFDTRPNGGNGTLDAVPADKGVETLTLAKGMVANLFASEEMFPELINPVQMDVDTQGRIWVAAWSTYPKWQPDQEMTDRLLILPDEDRDGVADKAITFAKIHNPTGFTFWNGGVVVVSAPNIWFLKDTDGDDKADVRELLLSGLDSADTHHAANNLIYGPDGYIYYQRGVFIVSNVETPWQAAQLSKKTGMYRFDPRTYRFSFHADNSPNPHGIDFDYWGYHYATDATSGRAFQVRMDKEKPGKFKMYPLLEKTVRPVPASGILSSMHFPEENNGNFLILNSIGFLGIKQYTIENKDGELWGTETDDLLVSSDGNFRPTDFSIGDDGALYVADWANPLIGHMQHNVRDPSRDHKHGRVYRITVEGRPLQPSVAIDGQPIEALLEVLKHPTNSVRLRARIELSERNTDDVIAATEQWIKQFTGTTPEEAHHLLEALWIYQQHNVVNEGLLTVLLNSPIADARRAAERVKYMWEIEGQLGAGAITVMDHSMDMDDEEYDYFAQELSPEPVMDGDTLIVQINTLKEQMKYDRVKFAVTPGMKVKLTLNNIDAMDHNLTVLQPDSAAEVAMAAMMLGSDGPKKQWMPESDKIIAATNLLSVDDSETIEFTAPMKLGDYDYICTYPGHWQLMRGMMYVVKDREKWRAENPNVRGSDDFVQEWTVADLAGDLDKLKSGRNLERGKELFSAASCITCHQVGDEGGLVGPNLLDVATRLEPAAMLTELIEPSKVINEQYQPWLIELDDFDEVYGLITKQDEKSIHVIVNPLVSADATEISRDRITKMTVATTSTMPTGLLNNYEKEEILDLMAYLRSQVSAK